MTRNSCQRAGGSQAVKGTHGSTYGNGAMKATPGRQTLVLQPPSPTSPSGAGCPCMRYTLLSQQTLLFPFSIISRGNTVSGDAIPQLSSLADLQSASEMATRTHLPVATHVTGDGKAWGSKCSYLATTTSRRSALYQFGFELQAACGPFWLSPSFPLVGDTEWARGALPCCWVR